MYTDIFQLASHILAVFMVKKYCDSTEVCLPDQLICLIRQLEITGPRWIRTGGILAVKLALHSALVILHFCSHSTLTGRHLFLGRRQHLETMPASWCHRCIHLKRIISRHRLYHFVYMDLKFGMSFLIAYSNTFRCVIILSCLILHCLWFPSRP
jgi:hypothetical protein